MLNVTVSVTTIVIDPPRDVRSMVGPNTEEPWTPRWTSCGLTLTSSSYTSLFGSCWTKGGRWWS